MAVIPTLVNVIVHLLIVVTLLWIIKVNKRGDQRKELLVIVGLALIVLSLMILDGAFAYIDKPDQHAISIWLFICFGCDFVAGLLALIARYFRKRRTRSK